jgi:hypothetical protein
MNYTKPEITSLASASFVIQGSPQHKSNGGSDTLLQERTSIDAYESDE